MVHTKIFGKVKCSIAPRMKGKQKKQLALDKKRLSESITALMTAPKVVWASGIHITNIIWI